MQGTYASFSADKDSPPVSKYLEAYQHVITTQATIELPFLKMVFIGAPRLGKTTMRRRLTREIDDIDSSGEAEQPSTGVLEPEHNVVIKNLSSTTAVVTPSEWSVTRDISEEARMLFRFIYLAYGNSASKVVHMSLDEIAKDDAKQNKSPASPLSADQQENKFEKLGLKRTVRNQMPEDCLADEGSKTDKKDVIMSDEEILEFFTEALTTNFEEVKFLLENTVLLSMSDAGGQPEFMDMQPALVLGPALYLIFCKLSQSLQSHYSISYFSSSGDSTVPVMSAYTVEEVVFNALSAVACLGTAKSAGDTKLSVASRGVSTASPDASVVLAGDNTVSPGISTPAVGGISTPTVGSSPSVSKSGQFVASPLNPSKSIVMIVGTHSDLVSEDEIKAFDADLQRRIRATDFFEGDLVQFATEDRLVLAVNNKSGGVEEVQKIQKILEDQMKNSFKKLSIPISWLIFSLCLRKKALRIAGLQSCLDLAQQLKIPPDEAKLAIWFLHHYAGLLMHFPDLPELSDSVICDLQIVYDSVTHLIVNTYKFGHVSKAASEKFRETGQFSLQEIREAISDTSGDYIPLEKLVQLLEHLNIIAAVPQSATEALSVTFVEGSKVVYFMPCVLPNAPSAELKVTHTSTSGQVLPFPLMIRFTCGFVPTGVFTAMMANLVSQGSLKMIVNGIRKNCVKFHFGKAYDTVTFICKAKHYEIHIFRRPTAKTSTHEVCTAVRDLIQRTLERVSSRFNYTFSLNYQLAFECPLPTHEGGDHLCVVESGDTCPDVMACLHDPKNIIPVDLEPQHLVWFGKVSNKILIVYGQGTNSFLNLTATP